MNGCKDFSVTSSNTSWIQYWKFSFVYSNAVLSEGFDIYPANGIFCGLHLWFSQSLAISSLESNILQSGENLLFLSNSSVEKKS